MISTPILLALCCGVLALVPRMTEGQTVPIIGDSAGIRIVEHQTIGDLPTAFEIVATPSVDLGGRRSDRREELSAGHPHHQVARLSDGRLVASDSYSLKLFDSQGRFLRAIGRRGRGPGEFESQLRGVCVARGDTIVAIGESRRLSVFTADGAHVRTITVPGQIASASCFADGSMLVVGAKARSPGGDARTLDLSAPVSRVRSDATVAGTLGTFPAGISGPSNSRTVNLVVDGELVHAGDGRENAIHTYSSRGTFIRILRWKNQPGQGDVSGTRVRFTVRRLETAPMPSTTGPFTAPAPIPSYATIRVDGSGRLWVQDHRRAPEPHGWTVFDPSGGLLGRAFLPKIGDGVELAGFDGDDAVLRWKGKDGAVHLSLHTVRPTAHDPTG